MTQKLTYAIGDIHGRLDLLLAAAGEIAAHRRGREALVVCLGDYVDRGPASRGVIDFLMRAEAEENWICLIGNHEELMIDAHETGDMDHWFSNGGQETLASYEGDVLPEHLEWLKGLSWMCTDDHRAFVHAGVMPGEPLEAQDERTCRWIRERFLRAEADELPCHIVHGHTPYHALKPNGSEPELLAHRTNLDTHAYSSGVLTVGVFDPDIPGGPVEVLSITQALAARRRAEAFRARAAAR
jgi:serine/threonine protein phosphatase 1